MGNESEQINSTGSLLLYRISVSFVALLCLALGAVFLYKSTSRFWYAYVSSNWVRAQGVIYESSSSGCGKNSYYPRFKYKFMIDGRSYEGTNILAVTDECYSEKEINEQFRKYAIGHSVTVFYAPNKPEELSCLEPGVTTGASHLLFVVGMFSIYGSCYLIRSLIKGEVISMRKPRPPEIYSIVSKE